VPGARLGRYQILSRLRKGGMAELYLARHVGDRGYEKIVAVKRVLPHLAEDATFVQMFLNEARIAAGLTHGNIAQVIDFGSEGDEHYLVLEYVHGTSVLDLLRAVSKSPAQGEAGVPIAAALTIIREVAAALHYAHEKRGSDGKPLGLVHRDVSPSNILVSYDGEVKLVDFGIAKATAHTRVTKSGTIKGKLAYMAPEQVRSESLDRRADVFSLAVVLYELCTGRRCFVAPGEFALINRVAAGRYEKPRAIIADFPEALEAIIVRGLAVEADERFESARALQLAIESFAESAGHRLSKLALSDTMHAIFGEVAFPATDVIALPPVAPQVVTPAESVPTRPLSTRSRKPATMAIAATTLVLGVGLGIGLPRWLADDDVRPTEPSAPAPVVAEPPPVEPEVVAAPPLEEPAVVIVDDTGGEPPATPVPGGTTTKRKPPRKRPSKPTAGSGAEPGASGAANDYLPPSRRPG
jgi:serine/threonine-protein kinase